ncbi:hypothetical protein [Maricaulis alexandrii]|uniref:hypothetical protein n=1 Tax=Maricaulis alexandrii TaxID=2570354 RepID=UPI0011099ED7|nr:hypothetical protein [Maricaulis alexandrii]
MTNFDWGSSYIDWKDRSTWIGPLTRWLGAAVDGQEIASLRDQGGLDICWDDSDWQSVFEGVCDTRFAAKVANLAADLNKVPLRVFHGCRVEDASVFSLNGIRLNDPDWLAKHAREIASLSPHQDTLLQSLEKFIANDDDLNRDVGTLFVSLDDRELIGDCSHYALYGSEWILSALGWAAHSLLREIGVPTILEAEISIGSLSEIMRRELAERLLQEWTHYSVNQPNWMPVVDFGICLRRPILRDQIVRHYHPSELTDVFYQRTVRRSPSTICPGCTSL